jgi:hypothetical protein
MLAFEPTGVASIVGELFNSEQSPHVAGPSLFGAADENVARPHAQERSKLRALRSGYWAAWILGFRRSFPTFNAHVPKDRGDEKRSKISGRMFGRSSRMRAAGASRSIRYSPNDYEAVRRGVAQTGTGSGRTGPPVLALAFAGRQPVDAQAGVYSSTVQSGGGEAITSPPSSLPPAVPDIRGRGLMRFGHPAGAYAPERSECRPQLTQ